MISILQLIGKKYTYEILKVLSESSNVRFKDLGKACPIEKMRSQRLRELEESGLIKSSIIKLGRRPVLIYNISERGREVLELLDKITKT